MGTREITYARPALGHQTPCAGKTSYLEELMDNLSLLDSTAISEELEKVRSYIVNGGDLEFLSTKHALSILHHYAFGACSKSTSHIALRCFSNIILLSKSAKESFINEGYPESAILLLKVQRPNRNYVFEHILLIISRIMTPEINFWQLDYFLSVHPSLRISLSISPRSQMLSTLVLSDFVDIHIGLPTTTLEPNALCEILKLTGNIAASYPLQSAGFSASCRPILQMLSALDIPSHPLQAPVSSLIDCLVLVVADESSQCASTIFEEVHVSRLVHILDLATQVYTEDDLAQYCCPLVQLLFLTSQTAPTKIKALLQNLLLPTDKDRERILGTDNSLSSRILRLSTSISAGQLSILIRLLLFELSDNDGEQLVRNIGYGYASGHLHSLGKQPATSTSAIQDSEGSSIRNSSSRNVEVNPLTGQRRDMETQSSLLDMTVEEKEREAERLFVLFERLRENGVIKIENPVAVATREGRLEDI
ncbi:synembryn [Aspergillus lucknowensis]|uniref:Guanine nucleotide exchange factor n=1 Tax=Aspergillus lucknowensis TaxID=176173 RepID=A0ABR4M288_9EURO